MRSLIYECLLCLDTSTRRLSKLLIIVGVTELCVAYGVNPGYLLFASFWRAELLTVPPDEHRKSNLRLV